MNIAEEIRERVTTADFCRHIGLKVGRNGSALCPFHGDRKTPSLKVYSDPSRGWHCFGCHKGGTVIDFAMAWYGITFGQALLRLDSDFGLNLPVTRKETHEYIARRREVARIRAERRKREQQAVDDAEGRYLACFDRYLACARMVERYRPKKGDDIDIRYAGALHMLPVLRYEFEYAQDRLMQIVQEGRCNRGAGAAGNTDQIMDKGGLPKHSAI